MCIGNTLCRSYAALSSSAFIFYNEIAIWPNFANMEAHLRACKVVPFVDFCMCKIRDNLCEHLCD